MTQTLDEILAKCCKVCGTYNCSVHVNWIVHTNCPMQGKYDLAVHQKCPYCGKDWLGSVGNLSKRL